MRAILSTASVVLLVAGIDLFVLGIRRYRLPYEDGRYFDPKTETVYHLQAAEFYLVTGAALTGMGLATGFLSVRRSRSGA